MLYMKCKNKKKHNAAKFCITQCQRFLPSLHRMAAALR